MPQNDRSSPRRHGAARRGSRSSTNPWVAALSLAAAIAAVVLSVLPGRWLSLTRRGLPDIVGDVLEPSAHFLGYAVLVGFASMACGSFVHLMLLFAAAIALSGGLEVVQLLVPDRGASLADLAMNVLGAAAGCLFGAAWLRRSRHIRARDQGG
jgi:VanZ family protein